MTNYLTEPLDFGPDSSFSIVLRRRSYRDEICPTVRVSCSCCTFKNTSWDQCLSSTGVILYKFQITTLVQAFCSPDLSAGRNAVYFLLAIFFKSVTLFSNAHPSNLRIHSSIQEYLQGLGHALLPQLHIVLILHSFP